MTATARDGLALEALALAKEASDLGDVMISILASSVAAAALLAQGRAEAALRESTAALAEVEARGGIEEDEAEVFVTNARALEAAGRTLEARAVRGRGAVRVEAVAAESPTWTSAEASSRTSPRTARCSTRADHGTPSAPSPCICTAAGLGILHGATPDPML